MTSLEQQQQPRGPGPTLSNMATVEDVLCRPLGMIIDVRSQAEPLSEKMSSRPRKMALLMDDVQEQNRGFARSILPNLMELTNSFRDIKSLIVWSNWSQQFEDGISVSMNGLYELLDENESGGDAQIKLAEELLENDEWPDQSKLVEMFWKFCPGGKSYLDDKFKEDRIDTVVIAGLWTDECIISTAHAALSRGYDVIVVGDAVSVSPEYDDVAALTLINSIPCTVVSTVELSDYLKDEFMYRC